MVKVCCNIFGEMLQDVVHVWPAPLQRLTKRSFNVTRCCVAMLRSFGRTERPHRGVVVGGACDYFAGGRRLRVDREKMAIKNSTWLK